VTDPLTAANTATFLPGMAERLDASDPVDKLILGRMEEFTKDGSGYLAIQNTRPQTIGYGLTDSPLLQLAWIAEKFHEWTDLPIDRDQLLTTLTLYCFTASRPSPPHTLYRPPPPPRAGPPRRRGLPGRPPGGPSGLAGPPRRAEGGPPARTARTGPSSPAAGTSRRWRLPPSWPRTCRRSSGRCTNHAPE